MTFNFQHFHNGGLSGRDHNNDEVEISIPGIAEKGGNLLRELQQKSIRPREYIGFQFLSFFQSMANVSFYGRDILLSFLKVKLKLFRFTIFYIQYCNF
ncbi:hypothetical protein [Sphingobacterium puteale]|uniref:hypothetical protein n=1 Tax=Sphingobacterium puteale TaxID=2420510 RepID=UPI0016040C9A|nr:hypothetical protein [Sphingobacterium puteale]